MTKPEKHIEATQAILKVVEGLPPGLLGVSDPMIEQILKNQIVLLQAVGTLLSWDRDFA